MKKIIFSFVVLFATTSAIAQLGAVDLNIANTVPVQEAPVDTSWKTGGVFGINFGQSAFRNWAAGGVNSVNIGGLFNHYRNYAKGNWTWDNNLDLAYGMLWQGEKEGIKSDDRIDFISKVGRDIKDTPWYWSGLVNFRSQFTEGFDDPFAADSVRNVISNFLAPAYVLASIGVDYKPSDNFTAYISPVTAKFTIVNDQDLADLGAFGVEAATFDDLGEKLTDGENFRSEFGAFARAEYKTQVVENVNFLTRMDVFMNYEFVKRMDVNWEALVDMKVNKFISATLGAQVLYDHDINIARGTGENAKNGPVAQFRQVLNVGFAYKF